MAVDGDDGEVWDASDVSWSALIGPHGCPTPRDASLCLAAAHECLRCMYDSELVIRSAALAALKRLCEDARGWCGLLPVTRSDLQEETEMDEEEEEDETGIVRETSTLQIHLLIATTHSNYSWHLLITLSHCSPIIQHFLVIL